MASTGATLNGFPVLVCGDVIREETERRGIEPTPNNLGKVMLNVRVREGRSAVARRLIPEIEKEISKIVVVEGIRNIEELEELQKHFPVFTVAIHSLPKTRFHRLLRRGRSDDPQSWDEFKARDERELEVGIGTVIALADRVLVNDGTVEQLKTKFTEILREVERSE